MPGCSRVGGERGLIERTQPHQLAVPCAELGGESCRVQKPCAVEIVEIVQRVRDVVGDVHDGAFDRLLAGLDQRVGRERLTDIRLIDRIVVELAAAAAASAALPPSPRVLQHGRADGGREVEPDARTIVFVEASDDAVRLRVALEPFGEAEPRAGEAVERLFTEVAERRVAEVVGRRGRLHDDGVGTAEFGDDAAMLVAARGQVRGDRAGDGGDLHGVGQPVVHRETRTGLRDHLGDGGQARVERREADPLEVDAEVRMPLRTLELVQRLRQRARFAGIGRRLRHGFSVARGAPACGRLEG